MTTKTEQPEKEETEELGVETPAEDQGVEFTSWEFTTTPTVVEVHEKLQTLDAWWGLRPEEYIEFIQPLSQSKNFAQPGQPKDYRTVWTLYVTVAGRVRMINDAAALNGWLVDFEPEPNTPTGIPGMLQFDSERIVYREYCSITQWKKGEFSYFNGGDFEPYDPYEEGVKIGRRPGTAWVPATGGGGAVASNRFEKVETSARGRAIAAWGFGVLPGSGIASLDEMLSLSEVRKAVTQQNRQVQDGDRPRMSREEMEMELRQKIVEYQQVSGSNDEQMEERVTKYVRESFAKEIAKEPSGAWDLSILMPGEIILFRNRMVQGIQQIKNDQGM